MTDDTIATPSKKRKRKPPLRPCSVEGCDKRYWARGYCGTHYHAFRRSAVFTLAWNVGTPVERFQRSYAVNSETGCWEWIEYCHPNGYGIFPMPPRNRQIKAHRFSYELHHGAIPDGKMVCHTCDNRKCVNPEHLYAGTAKQNAIDMVTRGRRTGSRRKLTDQMVQNARIMYARGTHSIDQIASIYSADDETVRRFLKGVSRLTAPAY